MRLGAGLTKVCYYAKREPEMCAVIAVQRTRESFMADRIFAPLGMQGSGVGPFPPNIPNRAISYSGLAPMEQSLPQMGAGDVYSTVNDLQLWEAELRNVTLGAIS